MEKTVRRPSADSADINKTIVAALKKDSEADRTALAKQLGITKPQLYNRVHVLRDRGDLPEVDATGSSPIIHLAKKKPSQSNLRRFRKGRINQYGDLVDELINMAPTKLQAAMELINKIESLGDKDLIQRAYATARSLAAR